MLRDHLRAVGMDPEFSLEGCANLRGWEKGAPTNGFAIILQKEKKRKKETNKNKKHEIRNIWSGRGGTG